MDLRYTLWTVVPLRITRKGGRGPALFLCWLGIAAPSSAYAQNWASVGLPTNVLDWGNYYLDESGDTLYCSGINQVLPGQAGLFRTTNGVWDTIGLFSHVVQRTLHYNDTLIAGGWFYTAGSDSIRACAFFDGSHWSAYGQFDGGISNLRLLDGELYAVGSFSTVDGQAADGIAKRVGGHWEPVGNFGNVPDPFLFDVIKYHGDLICCGNMDIVGENYRDVYIYQNGEWGPLGGGLFGTASGGWEMTIYNDELILGGGFYIGAGNAGQCMMRWNGEIWQPLGVGTTDNTDSYGSAPNIHALCVQDGKLFVGGGFSYAGHVPAKGIAVWDGTTWCGLGSDLGLVHDIVFFHDTLYAMCGNNWIDGEYNTGGVKYLHTTYGDTCSVPTSIPPTALREALSISVEDGLLRVNGLYADVSYRIMDSIGRSVVSGRIGSTNQGAATVPIGDLAPGHYLFSTPVGTGRFVVH